MADWEEIMEGLRMVSCTVDHRAVSAMHDALKTNNDCTLRDVSLFIGNTEWWALNKYLEIRLCLCHNARGQSIKEFVTKVTTRDSGAVTKKCEFKDIKEAILKDHNHCNPSHPMNHLLVFTSLM
jgi:hypothetical protein